MSFRDFLERLEQRGSLRKIKDSADPKFQIADFMREKQAPTLFEDVKGSDYRVAGGTCASRENIAQYLNIPVHEMLASIADAIENPVRPKVVDKGVCQEVEEDQVDLTATQHGPSIGAPHGIQLDVLQLELHGNFTVLVLPAP